jgi:hypothetical protein
MDPNLERRPTAGFRWIFVAEFRHWRSGKLIRAKDYGRKAFYILVRNRRKV